MMYDYHEISVCFQPNPVLSPTQSIEDNTNSTKIAIRSIVSGHCICLDGNQYWWKNIDDFVSKVESICNIDKEDIDKFILTEKEKNAKPIIPPSDI